MTKCQLLQLRSVDVFGCKYAIKHKNAVTYESEAQNGLCDHEKKLISIDKNLCEDTKVKVLLHELIHAALRESSADECLVLEHEEIIAESLAKFMSRLLFNCTEVV